MFSLRCIPQLLTASKTTSPVSRTFISRKARVPKSEKRKPRLTEKRRAEKFVDFRTITIASGKGGDGCSLFHRDKLTEFGGPSGGNGGQGGDIVFHASASELSLEKLETFYYAKSGVNGANGNRAGKNAPDTVIKVPVGTQVRCHETNQLLVDFTEEDEEFVALVGGLGGKGNSYFASSTNTIPRECTRGEMGTRLKVDVELSLLADAGLVGFPNAGKSTLLAALTRAKPVIADYEFTTLSPHIGILEYDDYEQISLADLPGIIFQAHRNRGLGLRFLCHIERCRLLLFVIDISMPNPWDQMRQLVDEFDHFNYNLNKKPGIILANKIDKEDGKSDLEEFTARMASEFPSFPVIPVSGKEKMNMKKVADLIRDVYVNST